MTELMNLKAAARTLGIPYESAYRAWLAGKIPYHRFGALIAVHLDDVRAAFATYKPRTRPAPIARHRS
jgi:hypothetical protein